MKYIPTANKYKLPKEFSYPLGAKEISEALAEVPQYSKLSITFMDRGIFWASKYKQSIKNNEQIEILEIQYYIPKGNISTPKKWLNEGYPNSGWKITVYAVPKENRHQANIALKAKVLPRLEQWLKKIGDTNEFTLHRKSFVIVLSTCEIQETK